MCLHLITLPVLGACLTRRLERIQKWQRVPVSALLLLLIYLDSFLFIFGTALVKHLGVNRSEGLCEGVILLCLVCYMSTKVLIYIFLVEKAVRRVLINNWACAELQTVGRERMSQATLGVKALSV